MVDSPVGSGGAPDIIVRADEVGIIRFVSSTCAALLGYEPGELVGKLGIDYVHPDDQARFLENTLSVFQADPPNSERRVHRYLHKDGSWVWLRGNPKVLAVPGQRSKELLNFLEPVSEEEALRALAG